MKLFCPRNFSFVYFLVFLKYIKNKKKKKFTWFDLIWFVLIANKQLCRIVCLLFVVLISFFARTQFKLFDCNNITDDSNKQSFDCVSFLVSSSFCLSFQIVAKFKLILASKQTVIVCSATRHDRCSFALVQSRLVSLVFAWTQILCF